MEMTYAPSGEKSLFWPFWEQIDVMKLLIPLVVNKDIDPRLVSWHDALDKIFLNRGTSN
jgi:hypothetical protein